MEISGLGDALYYAVSTWVDWKQAIKKAVGWRSDSLHVVWGVAIQFAFAIMLRKSLAHILPWLLLLALAGINEAIDLWRGPEIDYVHSTKDIFLTMLLPTVLMATTRWFPELYRPSD